MAASEPSRGCKDVILAERPGYFPVPDASLYTVLHQVVEPVARALLVGPFSLERHSSYRTWVQWARYLAERGIEALRYDYRGVGESTGSFHDMTFDHWVDDVDRLSRWMTQLGGKVPLVLHGLEMGGLLAAKVFHGGQGDALILWSAPANANKALQNSLRRWFGPQQLLKPENERMSPKDYFRILDEGGSVEVEGYEWSSQLWRQSLDLELPDVMMPPNDPATLYQRPVRIVTLGKNATPLVRGGVPGFEENKDFGWLFSANYDWLVANLALTKRCS